MALDTQQLQLIEQRVANDAPNAVVAYLLWFFLGLLGGHRFYLGRAGSGIVILLLTIFVIGLFISIPWVLIDAFLIPGMMRQKRDEIRQRLMTEMMALGGAGAAAAATGPTASTGDTPSAAVAPQA
ncbi:MAG TPA: NINE protein [Caulobacteraceae bacterium]|nr:NINE protein [Caulobacteraceae bacterium]